MEKRLEEEGYGYYLEDKEIVYGLMDEQPTNASGFGYVFYNYFKYKDGEDLDDVTLLVAIVLYELEHPHKGPVGESEEAHMTYMVYRYKKFGLFKDDIKDPEELDKDIKKIESLMHVRYEDLAIYKGPY